MNDPNHLWSASEVYAPDFPRASSDDELMQAQRGNRAQFVDALQRASESGMPGYYSVYSFPRGLPKNDKIPKVDTVFIDLDVRGKWYDPSGGSTRLSDWRRDMSALLARARMIGRALIENDQAEHFRVVLSGHKGIHLYLDLPEVAPENGDIGQFKNGLSLYGNSVMEWLDTIAGGVNIDPWVDVDASDLARLARHPNTRHHGAAYDDTDRWCVAITVEELVSLDVDTYLSLTEGPREIPESGERNPSQTAHDKLVQQIRNAASSNRSAGSSSRQTRSKRSALKEYRNEVQNDAIELEDVLFLTADKPCFKAFRNREDAYAYGQESRAMELSIMGRLIGMSTPVAVIHEFFEPIPGYDEDFTDDLIADLLARNNEYGQFQCATIVGGLDQDGKQVAPQAERFCLKHDCSIYRRNDDLDIAAR